MSDYLPIARRAYCAEDHWRGTVAIVDGDSRREVEAEIDVNPNDGTPTPRIQIAEGMWVEVSDDFVTAFRALPASTASADDQRSACAASLPTPSYPMTLTYSLETSGIVAAAGGHTHDAWTGSFVAASSVYPNGSLTLELRPVPGVTGILELGVGPTYEWTQPVLAPYGGDTSTVPVDFPQAYLQFNYGLFCGGIGRRYERLGNPWNATRADLRPFPIPDVTFSISPFEHSAVDVGVCNDTINLQFWASTGPDAHWKPTGPYFGADLSLTLGAVGVSSHYQAGTRQPDNPENWSQTGDLALTFGTSDDPVQGTVYGLFGAEQQTHTGGAWAPWGSAYGFLVVHPPDSYVGGFFRAGYNYLPPIRTGLPDPIDVGQFSGGLAIYPFRSNVFRIMLGADVLTTFGTSRPFEGSDTLPRFVLSMTLADSVDVGSPRVP